MDFPTITDPVDTSAKALAVATIKSIAISKVMAVEPELRALAEKYRAVVYDLKTPKGLTEAKAARHDLRENGRYAVQRAEQAVRDEANAVKKDLEPIAARLVAIVKPTEDDLDKQIKDREAEIEREKEAARQAEATRVQKHRDGIERINSWTGRAQGLSSQRISEGIARLQDLTFGDEWDEFKEQAIAARDSTFVALQSLYATTKAREDEAIRLEMQRQEQARVAAELKVEADRLAKAREELERQQREIIAAALVEATAGETHAERRDRYFAGDATTSAAAASPEANGTAVTPGPSQPEAAPQAQEPPPEIEPIAVALQHPTLKLGDICQRLGFTVSGIFVIDRLGIPAAGTDKRAVLFFESDYPLICDALVEHINGSKAIHT